MSVSSFSYPTLAAAACAVLTTAEPAQKVALSQTIAKSWQDGRITEIGSSTPPPRPARPADPELRHPKDMPRRRLGGEAGRAAFLHAIAHIEFNAMDLAWDIVARFTTPTMPVAFYHDFVAVARDEAIHFQLLSERLGDFGMQYGMLPAHDGLWEAAEATTDDLMARLALVPMVLEARGLDTAPDAADRLDQAGDVASANILRKIADEEVAHVAAGVRWFNYLAEEQGMEPIDAFHTLVKRRFAGRIKPPFNVELRDLAKLAESYYLPLATTS